MKVLGLFGGYYNPAACLVVDGKLVAFIEEEKLTRKKAERNVYPLRSVRYVLNEGGLAMKDVDRIAFPWDNVASLTSLPVIAAKEAATGLFRRTRGEHSRTPSSRIPAGLTSLLTILSGTPFENRHRILSALRYGGIQDALPRIDFVPHHRSHAASCFYASGFDRAVVSVMDGMGDNLSSSIWIGEGARMRCVKKVLFPNSLGEYYSAFTEFLGFRPYSHEGKVMGLAAYGEPDAKLQKAIREEVLRVEGGSYRVNSLYTVSGRHDFGERYTNALVGLFGKPREPEGELTRFHFDLAFAVQDQLEEAAIAMLRDTIEETGIHDVCLSGGVAMNCKMNGRILHDLPIERIFVNPASNDAGSAMGAAMAVAMDNGDDCRFTMQHPYWGPGYDSNEVEHLLKESKIRYERSDDIARDTAALLEQEKIVGWHQGRMEVGARALGARSILASPLRHEMLDKVNAEVKHREAWRPFAPALLAEEAANYYSLGAESPFMILAFEVLEKQRARIPAVTHVDHSCRPQTIRREDNPRYYDVIKGFGERTGVPVLMNTSFNLRGEPIVCTPRESLRCFYSTGLDVLAIEDFLVLKDSL